MMSECATPEVQEKTERYAAYNRAIKREKRAYDMIPEFKKTKRIKRIVWWTLPTIKQLRYLDTEIREKFMNLIIYTIKHGWLTNDLGDNRDYSLINSDDVFVLVKEIHEEKPISMNILDKLIDSMERSKKAKKISLHRVHNHLGYVYPDVSDLHTHGVGDNIMPSDLHPRASWDEHIE